MIGNIDILVKELCKLPKEVGWVEFKHNNCEPTMIGEDISALANTATLNDRDYAYMIWGVLFLCAYFGVLFARQANFRNFALSLRERLTGALSSANLAT